MRVETGAKRVRAFLGGLPVADTVHPVLVWETPSHPVYYFPRAGVRTELLTPTGRTRCSPLLGEGRLYTVRVGGREAVDAAQRYEDCPIAALRDLFRLDWDAMDAWFEEDEEVYTHPRNPYTRIDILASSRHVYVELAGQTLADSTSPRLLFETGVPTRYYLPKTDVRMELLERSTTVSHCPYKGRAEHWSARIDDTLVHDVAWCYPTPLPESHKIAGLMAFYDSKVAVYVDGERR